MSWIDDFQKSLMQDGQDKALHEWIESMTRIVNATLDNLVERGVDPMIAYGLGIDSLKLTFGNAIDNTLIALADEWLSQFFEDDEEEV